MSVQQRHLVLWLYESKKQCNEAGGKTALPGVYVNYPFLMRFPTSPEEVFLPAKSLSAPPVAAFALDLCRPCKFVRRDAVGTTQPSLLTLWRLHATTTTAKTCKSHRQKLLHRKYLTNTAFRDRQEWPKQPNHSWRKKHITSYYQTYPIYPIISISRMGLSIPPDIRTVALPDHPLGRISSPQPVSEPGTSPGMPCSASQCFWMFLMFYT